MREIDRIEQSLIRDGVTTVVDLPQAAAILRVSQNTVRAYRYEGRLRSIYPAGSGQRVTFLRSEIARYIAEDGAAITG